MQVLIEEERAIKMDRRARKMAIEDAESQAILASRTQGAAQAQEVVRQDDDASLLGEDEDEGEESASQSNDEDGKAVCVLVDNGSSRAASTVALRSLATRLQERLGVTVLPVSLKHSDKADINELGGKPALLLDEALSLRSPGAPGRTTVLPLFLGPSLAVLVSVPGSVSRAQDAGVDVCVGPHVGAGVEGPRLLAGVLMSELASVVTERGLDRPDVVVVDHGSPSRDVSALRDAVADALREKAVTQGHARSVRAASMERREGDEYAFADPLLANCLRQISSEGGKNVVLCMLFLGPGTHAGEGGDIDQICGEMEGLNVFKTRLLGETDGLLDVLVQRYHEAVL